MKNRERKNNYIYIFIYLGIGKKRKETMTYKGGTFLADIVCEQSLNVKKRKKIKRNWKHQEADFQPIQAFFSLFRRIPAYSSLL